MRRIVLALVVLAVTGCGRSNDQATPAVTSTATAEASATPTATACTVAGASTTPARNERTDGPALLKDVRYAVAFCPRVVFEFENRPPSYVFEYRQPPFAECGSGKAVDTSTWGASAYLVFHSNAASGVDLSGTTFRQTYTKSKDIAVSSPILRRLRETCDFEATMEWIVALDERHAFKVSTLQSPPRLVIDISQVA
jgi:hypothetical protein